MTLDELINQVLEDIKQPPINVVTDDNKGVMECAIELIEPREDKSREIGVANFILATNKVYQYVKMTYIDVTEEELQGIAKNHWEEILALLRNNKIIRTRPSVARKNFQVITNENYQK